jgi:hypothetical protein
MLSLITPSLTFHNRVIIVQRAPAPKEVIWENLHFSYYRNVLFEVLFVLCMLVMIWGGFKVQVLFTTYAFMLKERGFSEGEWFIIMEALVMSGLVVGLNSLLRLVVQHQLSIDKVIYLLEEVPLIFQLSLFILFLLFPHVHL